MFDRVFWTDDGQEDVFKEVRRAFYCVGGVPAVA